MKLGFIGTGHMGGALVEGFSQTTYTSMVIYNRQVDHSKPYQDKYQCEIAHSTEELVQLSDVIILSTPASVTLDVVKSLKNSLDSKKILVSCASGVSLDELESAIDTICPVVRAIPNIPVNIKSGAIVLVFNPHASESLKTTIHQLFNAVGQSIELEESKLNIASSIAGCSPAYIALLVEAMVDAGIYYGCQSQEALTLALLSIKGTAETLLTKKISPSDLKYQVSSPKGTTIKGVLALEEHGFKHAMIAAIKASTGER